MPDTSLPRQLLVSASAIFFLLRLPRGFPSVLLAVSAQQPPFLPPSRKIFRAPPLSSIPRNEIHDRERPFLLNVSESRALFSLSAPSDRHPRATSRGLVKGMKGRSRTRHAAASRRVSRSEVRGGSSVREGLLMRELMSLRRSNP